MSLSFCQFSVFVFSSYDIHRIDADISVDSSSFKAASASVQTLNQGAYAPPIFSLHHNDYHVEIRSCTFCEFGSENRHFQRARTFAILKKIQPKKVSSLSIQ